MFHDAPMQTTMETALQPPVQISIHSLMPLVSVQLRIFDIAWCFKIGTHLFVDRKDL